MNPVTVLARLCNPPSEGMAERNYTAIALTFAMVPLVGSFIGLYLVVLVCWAAISLFVGRLEWRSYGSAAPIVWSHVAFFAALFLADLTNQGLATASWNGVLRLFFLMPVIAVQRVAISETRRVIAAVCRGAAIGGILVPVLAVVVMVATDDYRAAGLSGNAGPFSILCLLTAGLAMLGLSADNGLRQNIIACLGTGGAAFALVLTGMRGAWPALPIVLAIALWIRRRDIATAFRKATILQKAIGGIAVIIFAALSALFGSDIVALRIQQLETDFRGLLVDADATSSLSLRAEMYQAGIEAFFERPLLGWGRDGIWSGIEPHLGAAFGGDFSFSHLHNVFLTVGVQAGLVGLVGLIAVIVTPVWCAWRARRSNGGPERLGFALILVTAFLLPGLTNIMLFHDILDAVWALSVWTLAGTLMGGTGETNRMKARS